MLNSIIAKAEKSTYKSYKDISIQQDIFKFFNSKKSYKVFNKYKITNITLENFGLSLGKHLVAMIPRVGRNENMECETPDEYKENEEKPFCCKFCGSEQIIKSGRHPKNRKQYYMCKTCGRRFINNQYFERMKANPNIICETLNLYFNGFSLRNISNHLRQFHNLKVDFTTVFHWIKKYIIIMDEYVRQFKPQLGDLWNVDEIMVSVKGDWYYLWNVIDDKTRFHLASVVSKNRTKNDARKALITAKKRSHGKRPDFIITDGLASYIKAIDEEFHTAKRKTIHVGNVGIRGKHAGNDIFDNNLIERLHGTIKERNKTQRGLKDEYSAFFRGHQVFYNFIRPHQSLFGNTPAQCAGINLGLGNEKWKNLLIQSVKYQRENS